MTRQFFLAGVACLALVGSSPALPAELSAANQAKVLANVQAYAPRMSEVALKIWEMPELGYLETKTTALLQSELKKAGFTIEAGVAGMPTSFIARRGSKDGPVIAILAEMDSLPGLSQAATPERKPIPGVISGHACGHNLFGSGSVAAAIAVKKWLEETGTKGQLRVYGTPAEEGGGGKDYMVQAGLFKDVDVDANLRRVRAPVWTAEETAFDEKLRTTLVGDNLPPISSAHEIQKYRVNGQKYSSTDSGDVSWVTPLATLNTATWVPGTAAHSWQATATGGMGIGIKAAVVAAKTLALTAAQLYQSSETIAAAKAEFEKSRGPNFVYKSLAGSRKPPLDYRKTSSGVAAADAAPG